jgi:hypothetical protein
LKDKSVSRFVGKSIKDGNFDRHLRQAASEAGKRDRPQVKEHIIQAEVLVFR